MRTASMGLAAMAAFALLLSGCTGDSTDPQAKIEKIAKTIKVSATSALALGLTAVPDEAEADEIATTTIAVMDDTVWPILRGDEAGFVEALNRLRDLSVFDDPKLEKLTLILDKVLPLLEVNLPDDLAEKATEKIPADAKAYITAFFEGVYNGAKAYMGDTEGLMGGSEYKELRKKLAEKKTARSLKYKANMDGAYSLAKE